MIIKKKALSFFKEKMTFPPSTTEKNAIITALLAHKQCHIKSRSNKLLNRIYKFEERCVPEELNYDQEF